MMLLLLLLLFVIVVTVAELLHRKRSYVLHLGDHSKVSKTVRPPKHFRKTERTPLTSVVAIKSFCTLYVYPPFYGADDCLVIKIINPQKLKTKL